MRLKLGQIKVPHFTEPSQKKYSAKNFAYENGGELSPIIVDTRNNLTDGYISYLILKQHNVEECDVVVDVDQDNHVYVIGTHPNNNKSYMWEVPASMKTKFLKKVKVGSRIYCHNKFGITPVIVSSIETNKESRNVSTVARF